MGVWFGVCCLIRRAPASFFFFSIRVPRCARTRRRSHCDNVVFLWLYDSCRRGRPDPHPQPPHPFPPTPTATHPIPCLVRVTSTCFVSFFACVFCSAMPCQTRVTSTCFVSFFACIFCSAMPRQIRVTSTCLVSLFFACIFCSACRARFVSPAHAWSASSSLVLVPCHARTRVTSTCLDILFHLLVLSCHAVPWACLFFCFPVFFFCF